jgi:hypothetical protein
MSGALVLFGVLADPYRIRDHTAIATFCSIRLVRSFPGDSAWPLTMVQPLTEVRMSDFEIAKNIAAILEPLEQDRRAKVLRWVTEDLGIPQRAAVGPSLGSTRMPSAVAERHQSDDQISESTDLKKIDIRTFVNEKQPKNDVQVTAAIVYYRTFIAPPAEQVTDISADELKEATRKAGRKQFKNPANTLNNCATLGYLDRTARGRFTLNAVGENLVGMTMPARGDTAGKARRKTKSIKTKTSKVRTKR